MYRELADDIFRDLCKLWAKYLDPDFPTHPNPAPILYTSIPHTMYTPYSVLHPL